MPNPKGSSHPRLHTDSQPTASDFKSEISNLSSCGPSAPVPESAGNPPHRASCIAHPASSHHSHFKDQSPFNHKTNRILKPMVGLTRFCGLMNLCEKTPLPPNNHAGSVPI